MTTLRAFVPRPWRRSLRIAHNYTPNLLAGRTLALANQQSGSEPTPYPSPWGESLTPIPDHGTAEIRANRLSNLQLAADRIDRLQWNPQLIFSFCHRVGDPSPRYGFRPGPVFTIPPPAAPAGGGSPEPGDLQALGSGAPALAHQEGASGWIVATQRLLRPSAPGTATPCRWRQNYQTISVFQPMHRPC